MTTDKERADKERADKERADKERADKERHDKERHDKERHDNASQDPDHPMNKTQARDTRAQAERDRIDGPVYAGENLMTEQERDTTSELPGVGPVTPSAPMAIAETVEEQGIGPRTPYPTGNPPPVDETTSRSQAVKGSTDKPSRQPSETKGPPGTTRGTGL